MALSTVAGLLGVGWLAGMPWLAGHWPRVLAVWLFLVVFVAPRVLVPARSAASLAGVTGRTASTGGPPGPGWSRPAEAAGRAQPSRAARRPAARWARAITDSIGLTPLAVGNSEASAT